MQTIEFKGKTFYSAKEVLKRSGGRLGKKTFEYLRDTLHLVPKPLKIPAPKGAGTIGFYPSEVIDLLKQIEREHKKGKSYPEIVTVIAPASDKIKGTTEEMRAAYEIEKKLRRDLSKNWIVTQQPAVGVKHRLRPDMVIKSKSGKTEMIVEVKKYRGAVTNKLNDHLQQVKMYLAQWDGKDLQQLKNIKERIVEIEHLEKLLKEKDAQERISKFLEGDKP